MVTDGGRSARQEARVKARHRDFDGRVRMADNLLGFSISFV